MNKQTEHLSQDLHKMIDSKSRISFLTNEELSKIVDTEKLQFLVSATNEDFWNYFTNTILTEADFLSITNLLYQLENWYMLYLFLSKNIGIVTNSDVDFIEDCIPNYKELKFRMKLLYP